MRALLATFGIRSVEIPKLDCRYSALPASFGEMQWSSFFLAVFKSGFTTNVLNSVGWRRCGSGQPMHSGPTDGIVALAFQARRRGGEWRRLAVREVP
jgi:hypothetical protein